ncbi:LacI family DNA-binding transcriptional regulator [PVC group bacterium]|nr:LacI family DNA-binding transcriptional regulator [PVC group bacterium]
MRLKDVSIKDVAKAAGVSNTAVSLVMNKGKIRLSEKKRKAILDAAENLGYSPNVSARRLVTGRTDTLGLVFPYNSEALSHYFLFELTRGISRAAKLNQYDLLLDFMLSAEADSFAMDSSRMDGIIVVLDRDEKSCQPGMPANCNHPCIAVGGAFLKKTPDNFIDVDIESGSLAATLHLIELGHKQIVFLASVYSPCKQIGYEKAMAKAQMEPLSELIAGKGTREEQTNTTIQRLLKRDPLPTAFVTTDDTLAMLVIKALHRMGIDVPRDISVVGFDDIEPSRLIEPALTTVRIPVQKMSDHVVSGLVAKIRNKKNKPVQTILPTELVIRESSARIDTGR